MIPTSVPGGTITFPMFGDGFAITPTSEFSVFGLTIHWYGVIIAAGFLLAYLYVNHRSKDFGLTSDELLDAILWGVPAGIIGARLYYVIFNFSIYKNDFWSIFKIWEGGLAIYGGVIGAVIAVFIYARSKKLPIGAFLDLGAFGLLIGQTVGRWGNFINREVYGVETDIFCRMGLTDAAGTTIYVHPTFLYESLWNLLGLLLLHIFSKMGKRSYDGQIFAMYVAWYGLGRAFIEGIRSDTLFLFNTGLKVSQVFAAITCLGALAFLAVNGSRNHKPTLLEVRASSETSEPSTPAVTDSGEQS